MGKSERQSKIFIKLKEQISNGNYVFYLDSQYVELLSDICEEVESLERSDIEIWKCLNYESNVEIQNEMSVDETKELLSLYYLYEFYDKLYVISDSTQYGSIINYVNTGILTKEEMLEALFYNIRCNGA